MLKNISMPVVALALGHLVTDLQAGALPIVLPHLKELFALSYSQLAFIVLTQNITSSVIQPLFGYITDKKSLPGMLPFCAAMAGAGFAFVGWVSAYALLMCTVVVIGVASATYHPQASKTTNFLSTDNNKAANMGLFSLGGNAGMAAGSQCNLSSAGFQNYQLFKYRQQQSCQHGAVFAGRQRRDGSRFSVNGVFTDVAGRFAQHDVLCAAGLTCIWLNDEVHAGIQAR